MQAWIAAQIVDASDAGAVRKREVPRAVESGAGSHVGDRLPGRRINTEGQGPIFEDAMPFAGSPLTATMSAMATCWRNIRGETKSAWGLSRDRRSCLRFRHRGHRWPTRWSKVRVDSAPRRWLRRAS